MPLVAVNALSPDVKKNLCIKTFFSFIRLCNKENVKLHNIDELFLNTCFMSQSPGIALCSALCFYNAMQLLAVSMSL